jgi:2-methylisocitrate lyase-like PEP mutase family enzyme
MTISLREAIAANRPLVVPSVYDGISARVAQELGFEAIYIGSYATGATKYGLPDIGYVGAEDMADQVRRIAPLVEVPIIVDGEGGFGNALHVARTIQLLERAGASGTHIEDHDFGKHITAQARVLPLAQSVDKIKAAVDARSSSDFMIIARTDSFGSLGSEEALARAIAFQEAGADGVFIVAYGYTDEPAWRMVHQEIKVPVFNTDIPGKSAQDAAKLGIDVVLYYGLSHFAAQQGILRALRVLAETGSSVELEGSLPSLADFDSFLGIDRAREKARQYGLLD